MSLSDGDDSDVEETSSPPPPLKKKAKKSYVIDIHIDINIDMLIINRYLP